MSLETGSKYCPWPCGNRPTSNLSPELHQHLSSRSRWPGKLVWLRRQIRCRHLPLPHIVPSPPSCVPCPKEAAVEARGGVDRILLPRRDTKTCILWRSTSRPAGPRWWGPCICLRSTHVVPSRLVPHRLGPAQLLWGPITHMPQGSTLKSKARW